MIYPPNYKSVHAAFSLKPAPRRLLADLCDYNFGEWYTIRLYRDNFDSLPESTRVAATEWVLETLSRMNEIAPSEPEIFERPQ